MKVMILLFCIFCIFTDYANSISHESVISDDTANDVYLDTNEIMKRSDNRYPSYAQENELDEMIGDSPKSQYGLQSYPDVTLERSVRKIKTGLTQTQKEQIQNGVQGAIQFFKFLEEKNFFKTLTKLSSVAGPIFSIASAVISIAFLFIEIESPEMALMKKEFANLNNRIDRWGVEFKEIKNMIDWSAVQVQFGDIERSIITLHKQIVGMPDIPKESKDTQARLFLDKYETDYKSAGDMLYLAMTNIEQIYSVNLFRASQKFTNFHRTKVQNFMVGMTQLLTQSIQIEATYISLKYENSEDMTNYIQSLWNKKLAVLKEKMDKVDIETRDKYETQYQIDLDDQLAAKYSLSNENFNVHIYKFLTDKYDWRQWFTLVYNEVMGFKDHAVSTCKGTFRFRSHGRNIIVSSVDKSEYSDRASHLNKNTEIAGSYSNWGSDKEYSRGWVNHIRSKLQYCNDADTVASVAWGSKVWYYNSGLVVYKKNCVNNNSPCYNTFIFG